jgi:uncharacterized BrkB/YihY/UPF0761 family membrane protein
MLNSAPDTFFNYNKNRNKHKVNVNKDNVLHFKRIECTSFKIKIIIFMRLTSAPDVNMCCIILVLCNCNFISYVALIFTWCYVILIYILVMCRFILGFFLLAIPWFIGSVIFLLMICFRANMRDKYGYLACFIGVGDST